MAYPYRSDDSSDWNDINSKDLSRQGFTEFPEGFLPDGSHAEKVLSLQLHHNRIGFIPPSIQRFKNLLVLDVSNNGLSHLSEELSHLSSLQTFTAKNNHLDDDSLPKAFDQLQSLRIVNLGGNQFTEFPPQFIHMPNIQKLYLGSNRITEVPPTIQCMKR